MKNAIAALALTLFFAACAGKSLKPKYVEEENQADYASTKEMSAKPEAVRLAARAALDELSHASSPKQASDAVKADEDAIFTGWVYSPASRDKYVQYEANGALQRKPLEVRRIYGYEITPSLAGSHVAMSVEEEVQELDLKTGEPKGWKRVDPEKAAYDLLFQKLKEHLSRL